MAMEKWGKVFRTGWRKKIGLQWRRSIQVRVEIELLLKRMKALYFYKNHITFNNLKCFCFDNNTTLIFS